MPDQPVRESLEATSDEIGNITFRFPNVPESMVWTGAVNIDGAPIAAQWSAQVADVQWGTWSGPSASPVIQARDRLQLVVTGSALVPLTKYVAQWVAAAQWSDEAPIVTPAAALAVPPFASQIIVAQPSLSLAANARRNFPSDTGWFDTTGWGGLRATFFSDISGAPVELRLLWLRNDLTASAVDAATRVIESGASAAANGANFQVPHIGDKLRIQVRNPAAAGGALAAALQAWLTTSPAETWAAAPPYYLTGLNLGDNIIGYATGVNVGAGATVTLAENAVIFGGWVTLGLRLSAFTNFVVSVEALDATNTWVGIYNCDQRSYSQVSPGLRLMVPPAPLRVRVTNNDAGAHNAGYIMAADMWRAA